MMKEEWRWSVYPGALLLNDVLHVPISQQFMQLLPQTLILFVAELKKYMIEN
jgi:hypothetical protein